MREVARTELLSRIRTENPWWSVGRIGRDFERLKPRAYHRLLNPLVQESEVKRAVVLMGPRRVGKTVLIHHVIGDLLKREVSPRQIAYVSVDHPLYDGLTLEDLLGLYREAAAPDPDERQYVFFDEVQYLRHWEVHLKALVDQEGHGHRFLVSGSAAAALSLKSNESGAGRFTDFLLPPLTFYEFLDLTDRLDLVVLHEEGDHPAYEARDIAALNEQFVQYLNFGGYPEVVFSDAIQGDPGRFIKSDIIDKVLLRDLPSLYGISDIPELNRLFTTLAFNTAGEVSLQELAKRSGVAKNTLKKYMEYLEAAFLMRIVHRVDRSGKRFQRARRFKVYLTNPSMRAALFTPVTENDPQVIGPLAETAIFAQLFHSRLFEPYYARWDRGEVDLVALGPDQGLRWAVEVKWSDRPADNPRDLKGLVTFCEKNRLRVATVTTRARGGEREVGGVLIRFMPTAVCCLNIGYNIVHRQVDDVGLMR
ncbi:MAG: ATP-binding protein [Gemmatimonadetes bacterium]|nr:MAG: ATP-binding protein [Gemmatimonadota bacterium]